jgi:hypothetical protein
MYGSSNLHLLLCIQLVCDLLHENVLGYFTKLGEWEIIHQFQTFRELEFGDAFVELEGVQFTQCECSSRLWNDKGAGTRK